MDLDEYNFRQWISRPGEVINQQYRNLNLHKKRLKEAYMALHNFSFLKSLLLFA
jgi:hypothetical protein